MSYLAAVVVVTSESRHSAPCDALPHPSHSYSSVGSFAACYFPEKTENSGPVYLWNLFVTNPYGKGQ